MTKSSYKELTKICVVIVGLSTLFTSGCGSGSGSVSLAAKVEERKSVVSFVTPNQFASEADAIQSVQIQIEPANSSPIEVEYSVSGTATPLLDFAGLTSSRLTIPAGATSASIDFVVVDDVLAESSETVVLQLTQISSGPAELGLSTLHTATIIDNESVNLSISDATVSEGGVATFTANLSATSITPVSFSWSTADGTGDSTTSYHAASGTVIIPPLSTTATFTVNTRDNSTVCEAPKTFSVSLSSVTGANLVDAVGEATITDPDRPTVGFVSVSSSVTEGSSATVAVALSAVCPLHDVTVVPAVVDQTAMSGSDYTAPASPVVPLTINAGQLSTNISIATLADASPELGETFAITLTDPANATIVGTPTHVVTINDPIPTLSIADVVENEGSGGGLRGVTLTVALSQASASAVTFDYTTSNGTAKAGEDYLPKFGTLTIAAGQTTGTISVGVFQDTVYETNETINVTLSGGSGYDSAGSDLAATITLTNDDSKPTVSFTATNATGLEGTSVTITATLSNASVEEVSVTATNSGSAIWMPVATAGQSYDVTGGESLTFTIPARMTSVSKTFNLAECGGNEGSETFILTLGTPTNATLGSPSVHTTTITDSSMNDGSCTDPMDDGGFIIEPDISTTPGYGGGGSVNGGGMVIEPAISTTPGYDGGAMPPAPLD